MDTILAVKDLHVSFEGQIILENLNFSVGHGDNLAIIGPNGSGKTVLLKSLLGMVPHQGEITWAKDMKIGYVPQKIDADRHLPINLSNLLDAKTRVLGIRSKHYHALTKEVGLDAKQLKIPIGHLSGGQFQRALLAFALLGEPSVLIMDEPTASIDKPGEEKIYELIHNLQDTHNITVISTSHDLNFVHRYADKVLCLNKTGLCFGIPETALNAETLEKLYGSHRPYHHHIQPNDN